MKLIISNSSPIPIYEQIKTEIIKEIMNDELKENEPLPSIRNLASDTRISIMTIKKAYDELEKEGYITTRHGKGSYVAPKNTELIKEQAKKDIEESMLHIIEKSYKFGIEQKELIELFKYLLESDENE